MPLSLLFIPNIPIDVKTDEKLFVIDILSGRRNQLMTVDIPYSGLQCLKFNH